MRSILTRSTTLTKILSQNYTYLTCRNTRGGAAHSRRVEQRFPGLSARRQRVALLVPEEGVQADGEAERVQDLVLHRRDERLKLLLLGGDAARTQVGVPGDRPVGIVRDHVYQVKGIPVLSGTGQVRPGTV